VLVKRGDKVQALAALEKAATGEGATLDLMLKHAHLVREIKGSANSKSILEGLVAKYPQNIELLKLLAESQYDCGEKIAAEETSRHSLHLEANQPDVHGFLGKLKYENGNLDQAVFHYSQQIALDPQGMNGYLDWQRSISSSGTIIRRWRHCNRQFRFRAMIRDPMSLLHPCSRKRRITLRQRQCYARQQPLIRTM